MGQTEGSGQAACVKPRYLRVDRQHSLQDDANTTVHRATHTHIHAQSPDMNLSGP